MVKIDMNEVTQMMVRDRGDDGWTKEDVLAVFSDGSAITRDEGWERYNSQSYGTSKWMESKPIEKKIVPLDSTDEIPNWCFGYFVSNFGEDDMLLSARGGELRIGKGSKDPFDCKRLNLNDACEERMYVDAPEGMFYFYKEVEG